MINENVNLIINALFLFIDGDHTKSGVKKDIELFYPSLVKVVYSF
tara:strand:+ start:320 stop:454 length:135 start_codon:yes stop_codon:yes gene_type:complete